MQCHIVKKTLLHIAFSAILMAGNHLPSCGVWKLSGGKLFGPSANELYTRTVMWYRVYFFKFFRVAEVEYGPASVVYTSGNGVHTGINALRLRWCTMCSKVGVWLLSRRRRRRRLVAMILDSI